MSAQPDNQDDSSERDRADMLRLLAGHDPALNDLIQRHGPKLFRYLVRSLQNEEDAADIAQETFVRVYQNRDKFDVKQKFSTWLYAIASNLVRTQFRYRSRHPATSADAEHLETGASILDALQSADLNPGEVLQKADTSAAVRRAISELPEELRTPLILSQYEDFSHAEIGATLNCSAKAVESRIYRARRYLRSRLSTLFAS